MKNQAIYKSILSIQVRFNDVDILGHVSNTVYQTYYDAGKMHYFDMVLPDLDFVNIGMVGASIKIDYLKPIFMKTHILVKTRVAQLGNKSLIIEHQLIEEQTQEVLSTCRAVMVCYAIKEMKSIPIPEHWRKNILAFDEDVVLKSNNFNC